MKIATFLLVLEIISNVSSFEFQDPQQAGVEYVDQDSQIQVTVDEYNDGGKTTIVRITDARETPQLVLSSPNADKLEAEIQQDSDQYIVKVNLFDYENLVTQNIGTTFILGVKDSTSEKNVTIKIKNLDDESPTIELPLECYMQEETVINLNNTRCVYTIRDPDGWLSLMTFKIIVTSSWPKDIFELKYKTPPDDNLQEANVYLVPIEGVTLDYEDIRVYTISIQATDSEGHPTIPNADVLTNVNVLDRYPVWTYLPSIKHIDEETETSFLISAVDPDETSPPKNVSYFFAELNYFFDIDADTGKITVKKIDREAGTTSFSMLVEAYYPSDYASVIAAGLIEFLVQDIDDNVAEIDRTVDTIKLPENSDKIITVDIPIEDLDAGENSVYDIYIEAKNDTIKAALDVSPKRGAGKTTVTLSIDPTKFARNDTALKEYEFELWTKGVKTPENGAVLPITLVHGSSSGVDIKVSWVTATVLVGALVLHSIKEKI